MMSIAVAIKILYSYSLVLQYGIKPNTEHLSIVKGSKIMTNPLDSLWGTVISGLVLTVALYILAHALV